MKRFFCKHNYRYSYTTFETTNLGNKVNVNVYKCLKCPKMKRVTMPRGAGE